MQKIGKPLQYFGAVVCPTMTTLVDQCLDAEAKNIELRQKLAALAGAASAAPGVKNDETEGKLRAIELMKNELALKQSVEAKELQCKRLQEEIRAHKMDMRKVHEDIQEARNVGQAPWETTGFGTIEYFDRFPTGLYKRTPTGASCSRRAPRPLSALPPPAQEPAISMRFATHMPRTSVHSRVRCDLNVTLRPCAQVDSSRREASATCAHVCIHGTGVSGSPLRRSARDRWSQQ